MNTRKLTLTAIFIAIIVLFSLTPLGFIRLPFIAATIIHVPVIIGSIVLGPSVGALLGTIFGALSMFNSTTSPSLLAFAFSPFIPVLGTNHGSLWALVVAFVPRILVGIIPFYIIRLLRRWHQDQPSKMAPYLFISGMLGSAVNTILVMNLIYFIFKDAYAQANNIAVGESIYYTVLTVMTVNGIPEALVAGIATASITAVLLKIKNRKTASIN